MRIKIINPNTTWSMTETIAAAGRAAAGPATEIVAVSPTLGPASIEGHYDEVMAALGVVDEVRKGESEGFDGYVVACFGDPGLMAAREVAVGPVVGIAEAAMHVSTLVATGFTIVSTLSRGRVIMEHLVHAYGMERRCRGVRATDLAVLDLEKPHSDARRIIAAECRRAIEEDGADSILLGCAGMADLAAALSGELGIPVIDGVGAAVKLVEAAAGLGLRTSKAGGLAAPLPKSYAGELSRFEPRAGVSDAAE